MRGVVLLLGVTVAMLLAYVGAASAVDDVGHRDFSFDATNVQAPTGEKPQSKLWFNDGTWWASMFNRTAEEYHIYRYDRATHTWSDTGTLIDERNAAKADTLWDGSHLYVATAGACASCSPQSARILRYSYDAVTKRYSLDPGFPVTGISNGGMQAIVLDKDTTGKLWVTYTQNRKVYVNRSLSTDQTWGTPFVLPVRGTDVSSDDISAVVAFDSQIGVMWSNQRDSAMYFATHTDGDPDNVWQASRTAIQGPNYADDHISLRSLQVDDVSGRVFAAVKTSLNDLPNPNPNAPLIFLLARDQDGNWTNHVFGRVGDNHTRPIVMIDKERRNLYMFATAPCCDGGTIYYKKTALSNISFPGGVGTPFIQSATDTHINNATSTKQSVNSTTGLMVLASDDTSRNYLHNFIDLSNTSDTTPPETTIDSGPSGTVNSSSATFHFSSSEPNSTFECSLDGGGFASCTSPESHTALTDGSHTFQVKATDAVGNTDGSPASWSWTSDATPPTISTVEPADGATGTEATSNVEAAFSEAINSSTIDGSTFTLAKQGSATPVAAQVTYDPVSEKATLDPDAGLEADATYTATLKGGAGGVKDAAGNPLAEDETWSFATASAPPPTDTTPPETTIDSGPSDTITVDSATFTFSSSEAGAFFECSLDGEAFSACTSPKDYTNLPNGFHTFEVRATDEASNVDATPASRTFSVEVLPPPPPADTTPPETTIDSGPSGTVNSSSASYAFSSDEAGSTFECKLDAGTFTPCTSPQAYDGLSNGSHTFEVRATDAAGNTDATPASRTWTVDTTAPVVDSVAPADGTTNVALTSNVEATFSEAMGPTTISGSTFLLLRQGATTPVTAAVSYDSANKKVTLDPNADLDPSATYTATLKGGASGVKDLAGNPLATDKSWSFSTAVASPPGSGSISIPSLGQATPYPATVKVSGLSGTITDLNVTLKGINHTFPDDIEALLVGPGGQKVMLMSDVGGGADLNGVDLTFDDEAVGGLPDGQQITAATYKPTRGNGGISITAPAGPYGASLSTFDGANPNGTYSLYVVDDAKNDSGQISGGFSVDITSP